MPVHATSPYLNLPIRSLEEARQDVLAKQFSIVRAKKSVLNSANISSLVPPRSGMKPSPPAGQRTTGNRLIALSGLLWALGRHSNLRGLHFPRRFLELTPGERVAWPDL